MNREILERRLDCLDYSFSGLATTEWVPRIAQRYNVTESAIWSDWGRRDRWLPELVQLDKSALKMGEIILRLERALTRAYSLMLTTENESVRIGATRTVGSLSKTLFDIGSQAGVYPSLLKDILDKLEEMEGDIK